MFCIWVLYAFGSGFQSKFGLIGKRNIVIDLEAGTIAITWLMDDKSMDLLNRAILDRGEGKKYLKSTQLNRVNIDSTVMGEDIKYSTDIDL